MSKSLTAALLLLCVSTPLLATNVVITTGSRGGSYFATGEKLATILSEYDYTATVEKSRGSIENIERVANGEAAIGFTQLDALAWWMNKNPTPPDGKPFTVLGNLFPECVYIAVNKKGPIDDEDDLQSDKGRIAVQKRGSGSAVTWEYMRMLEPGYAESQTIFQGGMQVLAQLADNPDGEFNAFMWVSDPQNLDQRYLQTVLNNENLKLIDVDDKDLNDKFEPLGRPIYRFEEPDVAKGLIMDQEINTICMDAVVIAGKSADDDMLDDVADILINHRNRLFGKE
ncbi:MAG: hypothetical protein KDJ38_02755 [Gammaproteobacteria bacterium]|nr:hypothetical protein [Gammaproteobacteria bacterium]